LTRISAWKKRGIFEVKALPTARLIDTMRQAGCAKTVVDIHHADAGRT